MSANSLAKNTAFLTIASALQKIVAFVYYSYLARGIGPAETGKYTFALQFASFFVLLMDLGLGPVLTREGARDEKEIERIFRNTLGLKIMLIAGSLALMAAATGFGLTQFRNIDQTDLPLIALAGVVVVFDTLTFTMFSTFRAFRNLLYESISVVIYQLIILGVGLFIIHEHLPTPYLVGALIAGSVFNTLFAGALLKRKTHISFRPLFNRLQCTQLLRLSIPFALAGIFFKLSGSVDTFLLKILSENRFVGWYSLAYKLSFALTVLPGSFASSFFPVASATFHSKRQELAGLFEKGTVYMMLLSLPIAVGIFFLADDVILSVYGEAWEASIEPLRILGAALVFVFWNYPIGNLLNAANKQGLNTANMGIALLGNVALNLVLIPQFTFVGAAWAATGSSILLVLLGLPHVKRLTHFSWMRAGKKILGIVAACAAMAGCIVLVESAWTWYWVVLMGMAVYALTLRITGVVTSQDVAGIVRKVWKK